MYPRHVKWLVMEVVWTVSNYIIIGYLYVVTIIMDALLHRAQETIHFKGALIVQVNSFDLIKQRSPDSEKNSILEMSCYGNQVINCTMLISTYILGSNGIAQFTLPPTITTPYQPKITIVNSQGQQTPYEDTNRIFTTCELSLLVQSTILKLRF